MRYILNRKYRTRTALLLIFAGLVSLFTGCASPFTDVGTDVVMQNDIADYLDLSALEGNDYQEDGYWNGYQVYTIAYGDFYTQTIGNRASIEMLEVTPVKVEYATGTMRLVELAVSKNQFVHAGDTIARVTMETNALDLEELQLKLQRLEERYQAAREEHESEQAQREENLSVYRYLRRIGQLEYEQADRDFARTAANYEKQIAEYQERIEALQALEGTKEICAPVDGYILELSYVVSGQELPSGTVLVNMTPADKLSMQFEDSLAHYGFGQEMTLTMGSGLTAKEYSVSVISATPKVLDADLRTLTASVGGELDMESLVGNGPFFAVGITNEMEHVLLIPAEAVETSKQKYYVTVLHEDNRLEKRQFLPGGHNSDYYWVFDGLEEGTRILIGN